MEKQLKTQCCIAGGGPAGMLLGYLLARAGVEVIVLEKHADFNRDFRGDTIHPSTFQLMEDLGLLQQFLKTPHQEISHLAGWFHDRLYNIVDFTHLPHVAGLMPQWDFLNFIHEQARIYPTFNLLLNAEVIDLVRAKDEITGVIAKSEEGIVRVEADLVVGADGRHSIVRQCAGLEVIPTGVPIDVLWFRVSAKQGDSQQTLGRMHKGRLLVMLNRTTYWQCAYIIKKGSYVAMQESGLQAFREQIVAVAPFLADRMNELNWNEIKLLSVAIDHLEKWYANGLLCIGDAAHAMSPVGGVGINLALQDAVAAANMLYKPLLEQKKITIATLRHVQKRREWTVRLIQKIQTVLHNGIVKRFETQRDTAPFFIKMFDKIPLLQRVPARLIGMGLRPERVKIRFRN
jgi:2-polyprenyl-6-methoxyphenol hydroxylase-like FAD-dependent oxidoreductase